jgi:RNA polymerase sigma-70 factor (sigma-E family)
MVGQDVWAELAAARAPALFRLAVMLTGSRTEAEDLVQETLARAHRHGVRIAAMAAPAAYLRTVMIREHVSWRRRARRAPPLAAMPGDHDPRLVDSAAPEPGDQVALQDAMWRALAILPPRQRAVLALRYYDDLTDDEIADALGCSAGTVRSHASRGLAVLRTHLSEEHL